MARKQMFYKVLESTTSKGLEIKVNASLLLGWTLAGGVTFAPEDDGHEALLLQAVQRTVKR